MRIESAVPGAWWIQMRSSGELTGADRSALVTFEDKINGLEKGFFFGDGEDEWELAEDGVSMVKRIARRPISREIINQQRDGMLERLITDWSFADAMPMPYHPGYLDREDMPLEAAERILATYEEVLDRIRTGGPKEKPETTATSTSTSPESSAPPQPDSVPTTAVPASGSPATAA